MQTSLQGTIFIFTLFVPFNINWINLKQTSASFPKHIVSVILQHSKLAFGCLSYMPL